VSIGTFPYVVFVPLGTILAPQAPGTILAISNFRACLWIFVAIFADIHK
jgi:hypothetical protein